MQLRNTFVGGRINKDVDERLIPKNEYRHAENIKLSHTEGSDVGAIENISGTDAFSSLGLTNAKTIGAFSDDSNEKIYWFVTSDEKDLVLEYDKNTPSLNTLLETTNPAGLLNFSTDNLITGVVKIINGDSTRDLIVWTDDRNAPRVINIERAKTYAVDGFVEDDISLIKKPPRFAPDTTLTFSSSLLENNIANKFLSFSYRYVYLDGEYSALSSFTNYEFSPSASKINYETMENEGMVNAFNAVNIAFDTGSERVVDIELVFKESNSSAIYLIERFNKENEGWGDDETQAFVFTNSKVSRALPSDEIGRTYDNVPRLAKALDIINDRIVFGNYVEQYNLTTVDGEDIKLDYELLLSTSDSTNIPLTAISANDTWFIDQAGNGISGQVLWFWIGSNSLDKDSVLSFSFRCDAVQGANYWGTYDGTFEFILPQDFANMEELATDTNFINFIESAWTADFIANRDVSDPTNGTYVSETGFTIDGYSDPLGYIVILAPVLTYDIDNGIDPVFSQDTQMKFVDETLELGISTTGNNASVKSNRSYEVGIKYLDEYNRATSVLTDENNTLYIPAENSITQNKIQVVLDSNYPEFTDRFKFVVKESKNPYQTIYTNIFYEDGLYRWVLLEGANKNKVHEGDILIVKSDLGGALDSVVEVRVLEVSLQEENFLTVAGEVTELIEQAGLYMKIKPVGFDMNFTEQTYRTFEAHSHLRYPTPTYTSPAFKDEDDNDLALNAGSKININITLEARGSITFKHTYEKSFVVNTPYATIKDWFEAEVEDLGDFGIDYTRDIDNPEGYTGTNYITGLPYHTEGLYDPDGTFTTGSGYGFNPDGDQFYVWAWRRGTASRNITTTIDFEVYSSEGTLIFETKPTDSISEIYYETEDTFEVDPNITQGADLEIYANHYGNIQNQVRAKQTTGTLTIGKTYRMVSFEAGDDFSNVGATNTTGELFVATGTTPTTWTNASIVNQPAIIELDFYNCFAQGDGAESYRYKDAFISGTDEQGNQVEANYLTIDSRPSLVSKEKYREIRRFADLTYSEPYNENTNFNGLNEFNLSRGNFKEDLDKKYGFIQKLYSRDTDILVFQEDKLSRVLYGKDVLTNADGSTNITQTQDVLGQQIAIEGEYGISRNPESFAYDSYNIYFTDAKRGAVMRFRGGQLTEISSQGLRTWFKDLFKVNIDTYKFGAIDPYFDQYVLSVNGLYTLSFDEQVEGWTSFYSYLPDYMVGMNNDYYSFSNGDLHVHHVDGGDINSYYGVSYPSNIVLIINDYPADTKVFKAVNLEGTSAWDVVYTTNLTNGTVTSSEFEEKEDEHYAYLRQSEDSSDYSALNIQGLGEAVTSAGLVIGVTNVSSNINIGDALYVHNTGTDVLDFVGIIDSYTDTEITVDAITNAVNVGDTVVSMKDNRTEGSFARGYYLTLDMELDSENKEELFAVTVDSSQSYQ